MEDDTVAPLLTAAEVATAEQQLALEVSAPPCVLQPLSVGCTALAARASNIELFNMSNFYHYLN